MCFYLCFYMFTCVGATYVIIQCSCTYVLAYSCTHTAMLHTCRGHHSVFTVVIIHGWDVRITCCMISLWWLSTCLHIHICCKNNALKQKPYKNKCTILGKWKWTRTSLNTSIHVQNLDHAFTFASIKLAILLHYGTHSTSADIQLQLHSSYVLCMLVTIVILLELECRRHS